MMRNADRELKDSLNPNVQNSKIYDVIGNFISNQYPIDAQNKKLELISLDIGDEDAPTNDLPAQKKAKVSGSTWSVPVYGHLRLVDKKTGDIVDEKPKIKIANIPKQTQRFSAIIDGNEYQTTNQLRLKSGIYTRMKDNGDFESQFNLAKGFNFKLTLDPTKGIFLLRAGNQNYRLYNILKALGVTDQEMLELWGKDLYAKNSDKGEEPDMWVNLVEKVLHQKPKTPQEAKKMLYEYFETTAVDPDTTLITLGASHKKVNKDTLMDVSKKLLAVQRGDADPDERDSLVFKSLMTVDDLLGFFLEKKDKQITGNLRFRTDRKDQIRDIISPDTYSKPIKSFFTTSDLSATPPQTNPVSILSEWRKTSVLGTGGIPSMHEVTMETRNVHPSHIGFLDPVQTPDSSKVGISLPLSLFVEKNSKGQMTTPVIMKDGDIKYVSPHELWNMRVGFGEQYVLKNGKPIPHDGDFTKRVIRGYNKGKAEVFAHKDVDGYIIKPQSLFGWPTNLTPFLEHTQGNRALMAAKNTSQAFTIDNGEAPLVQVGRPLIDKSFDESIGDYLNPYVPDDIKSGVVTKVTPDYIHIKPEGESKSLKIGLYNYFPMNQESFLHSTPTVKPGDVVKAKQELAKNNFEAEPPFGGKKTLGLGANVQVAYMPYKGYSFEDGLVVTDSFAKKFTHSSLHNYTSHRTTNGIFNKDKLAAEYPGAFINTGSYNKLDSEGIIKEGERVKKGDVLIAHLEPREMTDEQRILKNMNRKVSKLYDDRSVVYDFDEPGEVMYVSKMGRKIVVRVKVSHPLVEGDKLANRYGGKGIVVKIIPDEEAPHTASGKRVDMIMSPFGIPSRMNPSQLLETAAAKIAEKTGKPYVIRNFDGKDKLNILLNELKKQGIEPDEVVLDGKDGKPLKSKVFTGPQYILKLMHVVEHKEKSRSYGSYNVNEAPGRGESGGQSVDPMQTYVLLAHGAKHNLRDFTAIKSQKNDELWRAIQLGLPLPTPQKSFVFDKMVAYMKAAGVDSEKKGNEIQLMPLTDKKISEISAGKLDDAGQMLMGKNLATLKGGLFDSKITGGHGGTKWSHIELTDTMPSPMYEKAIQSLLGITRPQYEARLKGEEGGIDKIITDLRAIDVKKELQESKNELKTAPESRVNKLNKRVRYLEALDKLGMTAEEAYTTNKIPVMPPVFRPVYPLPSGDLMVSPINYHYRDISKLNDGLASDKEIGTEKIKVDEVRKSLYDHFKELQGLTELTHFGKEKYEGALRTLSGSEPKEGFIQSNVWSKRQDLSARSTITLDPNLGVDEVGIPTGMAKEIYLPFAVQELTKRGHSPLTARKEIQEETELGLRGIDLAMENRPVLLNRAPSLHKHSVQAAIPKRIDGQAIKLNPLIVKGFNADFDGDAMSVNVPVSTDAVREAFGMIPSKNIYQHGPHFDDPVMPIIGSFSQIFQQGLWYLTKVDRKYDGKKYSTFKKMADDVRDGKLDEAEEVELTGVGRTTYGKELVLEKLPEDLKDRTLVFDADTVKRIMKEISDRHPKKFAEVMNHFKELGKEYSYRKPITLSITDLDMDRSARGPIMEIAHKKANRVQTPLERAEIYNEASKKVQKELYENARKSDNRFFHMLDSGSQGKPDSIRQVLTMPGVLLDVKGRPIPTPVEKSWAEGVDDFSFWNHMYSARKGTVDRAVNTQDTGALNKALLTNLKDVLITEQDCGTTNGIELSASDKNVIGRISQQRVPGVVEVGDTITALIHPDLVKKLGNSLIKVRSPLTCETERGMCAFCYGLTPEGKLPQIGYNAGVLDGQAVSERATQLTMQTFHSGGSALAGGGVTAGFPELERTVKVPAILPGKAELAQIEGRVINIKPGMAGGWEVAIMGDGNSPKLHHVKPGRDLLVKIDDIVTRGEPISTGTKKPQELAELTDFITAQKSLVDRMDNVYDGKFHKRTFETIIRGISDNAYITNAPDNSRFIKGDTVFKTVVDKENKERKAEGLPQIEYKPYFKSINVLPHERDDWLSRVTSNNIKMVIQDSAAKASKTNIHGYDPMPAYLYANEFATQFDPEKGVFW